MLKKLPIKNKKIYISPYSDLTVKLHNQLKSSGMVFNGFIDSHKSGSLITPVEELAYFDFVLVCSPNYLCSILSSLPTRKVIVIDYLDHEFRLKSFPYLNYLYFASLKKFSDVINGRHRIKKLNNKHLGQRAFIIGNGPSLHLDDIKRISSEVTFAANKIWLLFDQIKWRPTYYYVTDPLVYKQNLKKISEVSSMEKLFPDFLLSKDNKVKGGIYFNTQNHVSGSTYKNINLEKGIYTGPTVIYAMIISAIFMGFKDIYLIGIDHKFTIPDKFKEFSDDNKVIVSEGEVNHFHKDYRKPGEKWAQPELNVISESFEQIVTLVQQLKINIYNASRYSELDVFERVDLNNLFENTNKSIDRHFNEEG